MPNRAAVQSLTGNALMAVGGFFLLLWMLLLSSAILPPLPVMIVMLALVIIVAIVMWPSFVRVYARAQIALRETLTVSTPPADTPTGQTILTDASLRTIDVPENSPAAGRLIRELELRTRTGASVVGIQRDGSNIVNPGPDEELRAGDRVLLLGTDVQLTAAHQLLSHPSK